MSDLPSYLDELDQLLLDQSEACMLLTQLDGFLAGILVSPDMVPPGSWLKHIWAGEDGEGAPHFDEMVDFQHLIDLVMRHYNDVLASLNQPGSYEPLFDIDTRNDDILWEMWIEGFVQAMAPDGWRRIAVSDDAGCKAALKGIGKLHAIAKARPGYPGAKRTNGRGKPRISSPSGSKCPTLGGSTTTPIVPRRSVTGRLAATIRVCAARASSIRSAAD